METTYMRPTALAAAFLAAPLLVLAACQPRATEGDGSAAAVDTAAVLASVDSLRSAYQEAVAAGDWQRLETMVTEDAIMVMPGSAAWDSMETASEGPFPPGATLEINSMEVGVLAADWAYDMGSSTVTWTPEGADEERTLRDTYLVLLHRTEDGWKVHREVANSRPLSGRE